MQKHMQVFSSSGLCDYLTYILYIVQPLSLEKYEHDGQISIWKQAGCGLTAKLGNWVRGPRDYLPTKQLAINSLIEHSFWVQNKAEVVTPLSTQAHYNCDVLDQITIVYTHIVCTGGGTESFMIQGGQLICQGFNWIFDPRSNSFLYPDWKLSHQTLYIAYSTLNQFSTCSSD